MMKEILYKSPKITKIPKFVISDFQKLQKSPASIFNILDHFSILNHSFLILCQFSSLFSKFLKTFQKSRGSF